MFVEAESFIVLSQYSYVRYQIVKLNLSSRCFLKYKYKVANDSKLSSQIAIKTGSWIIFCANTWIKIFNMPQFIDMVSGLLLFSSKPHTV